MNREQEIKKQAEGQDGKENHLGAAELSAEQNMNIVDGIPNNEKPRVNQNYVILENDVATHLSCPKINQIYCHRMNRYNGISLKKGKVPGHLQFRHR